MGRREMRARNGMSDYIPHPGREAPAKPEFKGPKLVPMDATARIHRIVKKMAKELNKPGARNFTFIIERKGEWNVQSTHEDDVETANILLRVAGSLRQI